MISYGIPLNGNSVNARSKRVCLEFLTALLVAAFTSVSHQSSGDIYPELVLAKGHVVVSCVVLCQTGEVTFRGFVETAGENSTF